MAAAAMEHTADAWMGFVQKWINIGPNIASLMNHTIGKITANHRHCNFDFYLIMEAWIFSFTLGHWVWENAMWKAGPNMSRWGTPCFPGLFFSFNGFAEGILFSTSPVVDPVFWATSTPGKFRVLHEAAKLASVHAWNFASAAMKVGEGIPWTSVAAALAPWTLTSPFRPVLGADETVANIGKPSCL